MSVRTALVGAVAAAALGWTAAPASALGPLLDDGPGRPGSSAVGGEQGKGDPSVPPPGTDREVPAGPGYGEESGGYGEQPSGYGEEQTPSATPTPSVTSSVGPPVVQTPSPSAPPTTTPATGTPTPGPSKSSTPSGPPRPAPSTGEHRPPQLAETGRKTTLVALTAAAIMLLAIGTAVRLMARRGKA
ncbi:hypothetical protein V2W30_38915 [Streptomyces sp. Q6]|uniref:Uncharacterized protein n=1 Tax=Streptomyces citrinus TaxID=3118173 RepID=A0ACD5ANE0_9ACTN